jgi:hypothetical protein
MTTNMFLTFRAWHEYQEGLFRRFHDYLTAGLPDGIFSNQKIPIWVNFGGSQKGKRWHILHT